MPGDATARRGRRRGELTVAAIARLAGVSPPTVSRVLNGRSGVATETRRRIEELLREHQYQRPPMVVPSSGVEVVFYHVLTHIAVEIMRGAQDVVSGQDLSVGFTDLLASPSTERSWVEQMLARRPVGVIAVHPHFTAQQVAQLAAGGIPLVALDPAGQPEHETPSVGAANWSGAVAATRHLLSLGHRRISVIGGPGVYLHARERLEACRAAMETAGVHMDPRLVRNGQYSFEDGVALGRELLSLPDPPTAVLCGNDLQALGVYEAARQAGLRIPDDLSVVGFDDIDNVNWVGPPLTTVRQPFREMGAAAADLLLTLIAGQTPPQIRVELPTTLVVRGSTAPPRH
ncbi:LacI family DNA-binding transcriptional regulator [Allorhizocola rhizosphaerae]|uniref:LacI family DNA-binding transcriptional regulator n=1 Tax=Allorhizocola rhizosphaerae TaxID=1872709 RepID=UPI000E3C8D57|nr:LacI family DNA-binding transcriptional regulator [Allorhizocola rhizosphaerae]